MPGDQRRKPFDDIFIKGCPGVDAVGSHLVKQLVGQMIERIGGWRAFGLLGSDGDIHVRPSLMFEIAYRLSRASLPAPRS